MKEKIESLIQATSNLKNTLKSAQVPDAHFDQNYGWNQIHISKNELIQFIENFEEKLSICKGLNLTELPDIPFDSYSNNIIRLTQMSSQHFIGNQSHLIHCIPVIIISITTINNNIENKLFNWDLIENNKLLPKSLSARLRSISTQINTHAESCNNIDDKIKVINEAHEAAESLPTDLASLKEAKQQLSGYLKSAQKDIDKTKTEIDSIKSKIKIFEDQAKSACENSKKTFDDLVKITNDANLLTQQCDDALQITTTQGLAAGFDQKAKELRNSLWIWISGLIIALCSGAYIGEQRVEAFTKALETNLTSGQALLHTIISIFSIGGPLWLAWISTQQINQRFKLSEDYSYKATVAKSFTGFKKLADRFDDATAQRLFNSTLDRFDEMPLRLVERKDYNSPWHEFIDSDAFKKAIEIVPTLAHEVGRFVNKTNLKQATIKSKNENVDKDMGIPE